MSDQQFSVVESSPILVDLLNQIRRMDYCNGNTPYCCYLPARNYYWSVYYWHCHVVEK